MQYPFQHCVQKGVAGLIPYEDKFAVISHSTKCSEGVADLVSDSRFLVSDAWPCLVSDSRILVSESQFLVSDSYSVWFAGFCIWFLYFSFWFARFLVSDSWDFGFWFADFSFGFVGFSFWFFVADSREVSDWRFVPNGQCFNITNDLGPCPEMEYPPKLQNML